MCTILDQPVENFGNFSSPFGTLLGHPLTSTENFTEIVRGRGEPFLGGFKRKRGIAKYSDFAVSEAIYHKRCKIGGKLVLITNRKSYMSFRLVPKSVTLNDLKRRNVPCVILLNFVVSGAHCIKVVGKAITMDNLRLLCLVVNVCRGTARDAQGINILKLQGGNSVAAS